MNMPTYLFAPLLVITLLSNGYRSDAAAPPSSTSPMARWTLSYSSRDPEYYHGLSFPDATHGWIVGDSGRILHSRDGGSTWKIQANPSTNRLWCVQFLNTQTGWAAGEGNILLRTRDGGYSWVIDHPTGDPARRTFMALHFIDEQEGWIAHNFGGLLHTRDGGRTWTAHDGLAQDAFVSMCFLDAKKGWGLSVGGTLVQTADGGLSWSSRQLSARPHAVASFSALCFFDSANGWIGTDTSISSRIGDAPPLFRTTNGGQTWSVQGRWPGGAIKDIWFQDAQSGWCAESAGIYSTKNAGLSWTKVLDGGGDPFVQMVFVGASHGMVLTFTGNIYTYSE
jgi:photosystem II stability/assembly factor-like uncharacterized protein